MNAKPGTPLAPGDTLDVVSFEVEAGKIGEFARATQASDPVHTDPHTAIRAGFTAVAATPTHVVVAGHHRNQQEFVRALDMDIKRIVVGSVRWDYARPLVAGDQLTGTRCVLSDERKRGKRGGLMRLVTLETAWVDSAGQAAVTQREVLIERGA
ncbi:FAS1-like dehydratase domain-containing protein [Gordonia sp. MP11Mi]|uniref:FAS1-like dehydratase domain-containing protein n=1 Tax=Gordonia sp. MP11Mi TaxID=3022769 RepID=A0AA97CVF1_9ACTN